MCALSPGHAVQCAARYLSVTLPVNTFYPGIEHTASSSLSSMDSTYLLATVPALLVLAYSFRRRSTKSLPPGPKGSFLVGNLAIFQLEGEEKAKACLKWLQDYGIQ